jgi:hypothetical protein
MDALRDGFDAFLDDMAGVQRARGELPTVDENQRMAAALFAEGEAKGAFVQAPSVSDTALPSIDKLTVTPETDEDRARDLSPTLGYSAFAWSVYMRLSLLLKHRERGARGQPSWHERVSWAQQFALRKDWKRYSFEVLRLLDESIKHFGPWKAVSL